MTSAPQPAPKYYVCSDSIFQRLREETQALFERYPEDDGVMIFAPNTRIERQAKRIVALEAEVRSLRAYCQQLINERGS